MSLRLENVEIAIGRQSLLKIISLEIAAGEIVTLMGPSGSGKSSLLAGIAGTLASPFHLSGQVRLNGHELAEIPPERRRVGRLFQDDLLFPHLTVGENLLFGMARGARTERLAQAIAALQEIGLAGFEDRSPHTLSGGQRQRVSLMRSLLAKPDCMLLDEPFSKLDKALRDTIRSTTFELLKRHNTPTLLVTHDMADAPKGSRVLKIENGEIKHV